jgi:hypothetical protein
MARGERRDQLVRDEGLADARALVEARDERVRDARGVEARQHLGLGELDVPHPGPEGLLGRRLLVEDAQVAEHLVREVRRGVREQLGHRDDRRPHVDRARRHAAPPAGYSPLARER